MIGINKYWYLDVIKYFWYKEVGISWGELDDRAVDAAIPIFMDLFSVFPTWEWKGYLPVIASYHQSHSPSGSWNKQQPPAIQRLQSLAKLSGVEILAGHAQLPKQDENKPMDSHCRPRALIARSLLVIYSCFVVVESYFFY